MAFFSSGVTEALYSGTGDEDALMRHDHLLELERIVRRTGLRLEIGVVDRQRIVGERNARDVGVDQRQFLGRQRRQPDVMRAGAGRAGKTRIFGAGMLSAWACICRICRNGAPSQRCAPHRSCPR